MHLVFADANVLYSRTLRDWTFLLSEESGMYSVISSREAVVEAMSSLRNTFPEFSGDQISAIQDRIEGALGDLITSFPGGAVEGIADPGDFHIYNAAAYAGAHILLTQNVKDFADVQDPRLISIRWTISLCSLRKTTRRRFCARRTDSVHTGKTGPLARGNCPRGLCKLSSKPGPRNSPRKSA